MTAPRAQLNHMLMDVDFFDKPTVRALGFKHTQVAVLLYVRWLMLMSRATNALVTRDAMASIAREVLHGMGAAVATFESVLDYCLDTGMIFEESPGMYSNERVVKDQESCALKRIGAVQRQNKYRGKKTESGNALVTRLPVTVSDTDTELDIKLESRPEHWNFTGPLDRPEIREWAPKLRQKIYSSSGRTWGQFELESAVSNHGIDAVIAGMRFTCTLTVAKNLCFPSANGTRDGPARKKTGSELLEEMKSRST